MRRTFVFFTTFVLRNKTNEYMAKELKELTKSDENYSQWYNDLVVKAGLAENSAVRSEERRVGKECGS